MGRERGQPAGALLPAHCRWQGAAHTRARSLVAAGGRDRPRHEPGTNRQGVTRMHPDQDDLDEEIRGHIALSVKERIERGEDPDAARLAALREFGNVTLTRDSMRAVWRPRGFEMAEALWH